MVRKKGEYYDLKILKGLIFGSFRSKQQLQKTIKIPYVQAQRRIPKLKQRKFIYLVEKSKRKDGKRDKRQPERWGITWRGLVYLAVKTELKEKEIAKALPKLSTLLGFSVVESEEMFLIRAFSRIFVKMRSRVNLENFDERYVQNLVGNLMMEELMEYFSSLRKQATKEEKSRVKKIVKKTKVKQDLLKFFKANLYSFKKTKRKIEDNIELCKQAIEFLECEA